MGGRVKVKFGWLLLAPSFAIVGAGLIGPLVYGLIVSFTNQSLLHAKDISFIGMENYWRALHDAQFWGALGRGTIYTLLSVSGELLLGGLLAWVLWHKPIGYKLFRTAFLVPMVLVPVVVGFSWRFLLQPAFSPLPSIFSILGVDITTDSLLTQPRTALLATIAVNVWQWMPFTTVLVLAALQSLPEEVYDAARIDGAGVFTCFRYITLPLISPLLITIMLLRGMDSMRNFDTIYILTGGGPGNATENLAVFNYRVAFKEYSIGYASAISIVYLIIMLIGALILLRRVRAIFEGLHR